MKLPRLLLLCFLLPALERPLTAEEAFIPPPGGTEIWAEDITAKIRRANVPAVGTMEVVTVADAPKGAFTTALQAETRVKPETTWSFEAQIPWPGEVKKGDVIWMSFWARALRTSTEQQVGNAEMLLDLNHPPFWPKACQFETTFGREWKPFAFAYVAGKAYAAGELRLVWRCGYPPQTIQIAGVRAINYGSSVAVRDLPRSKNYYLGMEPDAPWRKAAAERIEKYRKGDLSLAVTDAKGKPLPGAEVAVKQIRHAFGFGSCVTARLLTEQSPAAERYRDVIRKSYSKVVFENDLKWGMWENPRNQENTLAALRWLQDEHIAVRGHTLVWPSWKNAPRDLPALKDQPEKLRERIENHIRQEAGATRGLLTEWDVVNEPYGNHDFLDVLGQQALVEWFRLARETDPKPVLYLNDYAALMPGGPDTAHKRHFEKTLRYCLDQKAPIGGLGIQAHFGALVTPPEQIVAELDKWATLGLDIQITEFDFSSDDEAFQAQFTRDFMTAVFSHPSVSALLTWGFWEKSIWIPRCAMYRADWSLKPNGEAWNDLVLKQWRTKTTGKTGADGRLALRGFLGDYEITVRHNGKARTVPLTLSKEGAKLSVRLE